MPYAIAADISWMTDYGMQVAMNYANRQEGWTNKDIWFNKIDWFDVGMSAVIGGATAGSSAELKAGKELGKLGTWIAKNSKLISVGEMVATSAIDITGEGWQPVNMNDFTKRVGIGLTMYGINDIVGNAQSKKTLNAKQKIETINGIEIEGFQGHGVNRAIGDFDRAGLKPEAILDALQNPLQINDVVIDNMGRPSQRFIGRFGEVVINPLTGKIISVNPTSTNKVLKLLKYFEE